MFRNNDLDCLHNRFLTGSHLALSLLENKWPKCLAKKRSPSLSKNKSRWHQVNNILLQLSGCLCYSCSTNKHWSLVTCLHVWAFKSWQPQPSFMLIPPKKIWSKRSASINRMNMTRLWKKKKKSKKQMQSINKFMPGGFLYAAQKTLIQEVLPKIIKILFNFYDIWVCQ